MPVNKLAPLKALVANADPATLTYAFMRMDRALSESA
jgi:hypothetical protein